MRPPAQRLRQMTPLRVDKHTTLHYTSASNDKKKNAVLYKSIYIYTYMLRAHNTARALAIHHIMHIQTYYPYFFTLVNVDI